MLPRVLHVVPAVAPRYGGPSVAVLGMGRALRAAGCWTVIATSDADGRGRLDVPIAEIVAHDEVPCIFFRRVCSESFKWSPGLAAWLAGHVAEFDLVHVHGVFSHVLIAAARACRARGVPYIVRPLGTLDPWSLAHHGWRKQVLLQGGGRRALAGASAMHFTSEEERRLAEATLPWLPAGAVVPLGVENDLFASIEREAAPGAKPYILSLARLDPKKGIDRVIRAFHDATGRGGCRDWRLVVAGDGEPEYVQSLQALARSGPAADRIGFEGWVTGTARRALIQQASLFALPSSQENFGISVVEAMAAGVPVIVSPGVNLAREIEAAGAGWMAEDTDTLAGLLATVCAAPADLRARGGAARQWAERYRWPQVTRALMTLYADIAGRAVRADRLGAEAERSVVATGGRL